MNGRTGFAYLMAPNPFRDPSGADQQIYCQSGTESGSWQDSAMTTVLANNGLPGLEPDERTTHGDNITLAAGQGSEWELATLIWPIPSRAAH